MNLFREASQAQRFEEGSGHKRGYTGFPQKLENLENLEILENENVVMEKSWNWLNDIGFCYRSWNLPNACFADVEKCCARPESLYFPTFSTKCCECKVLAEK